MKNVHLHFIVIFVFLLTVSSLYAQNEWKVPLTVSCDDWEKVLYFGSHPNGTDAYDAGLDTLSPPPGFGPYAYFYISAFPNFLVSDIRKCEEGTTWLLRTANCSGNEVKLKWDLTTFQSIVGQNGNLEIGEYGSMLEQDSLVLTGDVSLEILFNTTPTIIAEKITDSPADGYIRAAYPNPFNSLVNVSFYMPGSGYAEMAVHDILGRKVVTLFQGRLDKKEHTFTWDGTDYGGDSVSSGVYFVRVTMNNKHFIQKIQLLR